MKKKELKSKYLAVRMQEEMYNKLNNQSIFFDVSIGTIIRKAINDYLDKNNHSDIIQNQHNKSTDGK